MLSLLHMNAHRAGGPPPGADFIWPKDANAAMMQEVIDQAREGVGMNMKIDAVVAPHECAHGKRQGVRCFLGLSESNDTNKAWHSDGHFLEGAATIFIFDRGRSAFSCKCGRRIRAPIQSILHPARLGRPSIA